MAKKKKFDPMGSGYDYETAKKEGGGSDKTGHWYSRSQKGTILKGRKVKSDDGVSSFGKTQAGEELRGYEIKFKKGRYRSQKKDSVKVPKGGRVEIK